MEKFKRILKKIWLPVVTVALIGLGALALTGAIGIKQKQENNKTVYVERKLQATATPAPAATAVEVSPGPFFQPVSGKPYMAMDVLGEDSATPTAADINYIEAADSAAQMIKAAFGDDLAQRVLNCHYDKLEGVATGMYEVLVFTADDAQAFRHDDPLYRVTLDSVSGKVQSAQKLAAQTSGAAGDAPLTEPDENTRESVMNAAASLIRNEFANGRRMLETSLAGEQAEPNERIFDCNVRMETGDCYRVRVAYPGLEIRQIDIYSAWETGPAIETPRPAAAETAAETTAAPVPLPKSAK